MVSRTAQCVCGPRRYDTKSRVEYVVEFLGDIGLLLEIFYRSSISPRFSLASSLMRTEAFQYYKSNTSSLRKSYVDVEILRLGLWFRLVEQWYTK